LREFDAEMRGVERRRRDEAAETEAEAARGDVR
jgi:hypothetical protein